MSDTDVKITLPRAVTVNGTPTTDFVLREPKGRDLRNHTVMDLIEGNVRALSDVTPKVITPFISPDQIKDFAPGNLMALTSGFAAFLDGMDFDQMVTKQTVTSSPTRGSSSAQKAE